MDIRTGRWTSRALRLFPGGSNGEFGIPHELLVIPERGQGAKIWDTEGREFLDFTMAWVTVPLADRPMNTSAP